MDWTSIVITVVSTLVSIAVGGSITFLVTRRYYVRASEDLRQETDNLRRLTIMLLHLMDQADLIPIKWDEQGNPLMTVTVDSPPINTHFRKPKAKDKETASEESSRD
jgi:hypothetical protein